MIETAVSNPDQAIREWTLGNGLKVILLENHKAPVVTFQIWYRAGARNEHLGKTGLAHLFEHMMFKGTKNVSAEEFVRRIHRKGAAFNAFTSHDFAGYVEQIASAHIQEAMNLEADRMQHLIIEDDDFEIEKQVVMEERMLRIKDNKHATLLEQVNAAAFQCQPYRWPISGWTDDIARLSADDARNWYRTYYHPGNALISAVGDFQADRLLESIRDTFEPIPGGDEVIHRHYADPPQEGERRVTVKSENAHLPLIIMAYHAPNILNPDSYILEVVSAVLSGGRSARLRRRLVHEERTARQIQSRNSFLTMDPDLFIIRAEPFQGVETGVLEGEIEREIEKTRRWPVDDRELQKAKNRLEAAFVYAQDSTAHQAVLLARYQTAADWREMYNYIRCIRSVSAEDICRIAGKYLIPENKTVGVLIPAPSG
ncbi:MAG: insulinase family protein [Desulfobacteraceae bacterium]|nr:MAG: insulinase family protein [Desulfobacteraceae bacterium]